MKQVIIMRSDLVLGIGKAIAQGAHASVGSMRRATQEHIILWAALGQKKIVLVVESEQLLIGLSCLAAEAGLPWYLVRDSGRTEVDPGTITALAIGPASDIEIDRITSKRLPLYRDPEIIDAHDCGCPRLCGE